MILYNVTFIINSEIHLEWLHWMENEHIPKVMATEKFISNRLLKVLNSPNEGLTYCSQYIAERLEDYNQYHTGFEAQLLGDIPTKFAEKLVTFSTLMEFVR